MTAHCHARCTRHAHAAGDTVTSHNTVLYPTLRPRRVSTNAIEINTRILDKENEIMIKKSINRSISKFNNKTGQI